MSVSAGFHDAGVEVPLHAAPWLLAVVRPALSQARRWGRPVPREVDVVVEGLEIAAAQTAMSEPGRVTPPTPDIASNSESWITTQEAAEALNFSERHIRRLSETGRLNSQKAHGRLWFRRSDVDEFQCT